MCAFEHYRAYVAYTGNPNGDNDMSTLKFGRTQADTQTKGIRFAIVRDAADNPVYMMERINGT